MKIGIMLRHYDQHGGGVKVYTRGLLRELLTLNSAHEFILIYQNPSLVGSYGNFSNVREISISSRSKLIWDQIVVSRVAESEKLDLIFNPKYSLPLSAKCKTVFVSHGMDWYVMPKWSKLIDRLSHQYIVPKYAKKADAIIAVSNITKEHVIKYLNIPSDKVHTVYLGLDEAFKLPVSQNDREKIQYDYQLPKRFLLYVGQIYPPKNFGRLLQAYAKVGPNSGTYLVVAGEHRWLCKRELALIDKLNISSWVVRTGWIDRTDLPGFYALAEALLLPSLYESFGLPLVEAMSVGCPVLTSDRYGTAEIVGKGGLLVNPEDVESIADGMLKVLTDSMLREKLIKEGKDRAGMFSWEKCARETLNVLETIVN